MEQPDELRELANWYRGWDSIGTESDRAWREGLADYLEKVASELEAARTLERAGEDRLH